MTDFEKGYLAGIIDGEGTITLTKESRYLYRYPAIQISSTTREILEKVQQIIGSGSICQKHETAPNAKQAYSYKITRRKVIEVLEEITDFLQEPKKKARAMLIL